jgi:hypothetical protein
MGSWQYVLSAIGWNAMYVVDDYVTGCLTVEKLNTRSWVW